MGFFGPGFFGGFFGDGGSGGGYFVQEADGTSKFTLEDGSGSFVTEDFSTGGGGGGALTAPTFPTFAARWRADSITGLNGDPISAWPEYSGGASFTQTGTNRPTLATNAIDGEQAVQYTSANSQYMALGSSGLGLFRNKDQFIVFMVAASNTAPSGASASLFTATVGATAGGLNVRVGVQRRTTSQETIVLRQSDAGSLSTMNAGSPSTFSLSQYYGITGCYYFISDSSTAAGTIPLKNGRIVQNGTIVQESASFTSAAGPTTDEDSVNIYMGGDPNVVSSYHNGPIAEVAICYDTSFETQATLEAYRKARYSGQKIGIFKPYGRQTIKENADGTVDLIVSGFYKGSPAGIEASYNGGPFQTICTGLTPNSDGSVGFIGKLTGQPFGQGALIVRHTDNTANSDTQYLVGIGVVGVGSGQSNNSGRGTNNQFYKQTTLSASATSSTTTFSVTDNTVFNVGDYCITGTLPSSEIVKVTGTGTGTITVTRAQHGTKAQALSSGATIFTYGPIIPTIATKAGDYRVLSDPTDSHTYLRYPIYGSSGGSGSYNVEFAGELVNYLGKPYMHIPCPRGGTAVLSAGSTVYWYVPTNPTDTTTLMGALIARAQREPNGVSFVYWHQGESDLYSDLVSNTTEQNQIDAAHNALANAVGTNLGCKFIVTQLQDCQAITGSPLTPPSVEATMRTLYSNLVATNVNVKLGADLSDLSSEDNPSPGLHLTADATLKTAGGRVKSAVVTAMGW